MRRALALTALLALGGCATDAYYTGYATDPAYRYYDNSPYVYEGYQPYGYPAYPSYYYGAPVIGGGVYYDGDRDRRYRHRDRDDRRDDRRGEDRDDRAPAERWDPNNVTRPRGVLPGEVQQRVVPGTSMTPQEHQGAAGR